MLWRGYFCKQTDILITWTAKKPKKCDSFLLGNLTTVEICHSGLCKFLNLLEKVYLSPSGVRYMGQPLNVRNRHLTSLERPLQMAGKDRSNRPNGSLKENGYFHFSAICLPQLCIPSSRRF